MVGNFVAKFFLVNEFELVDGFPAQLQWRFHTSQFIGTLMIEKRSKLAANGKSCIL
jgi:hypothetical protein